MSERVGTERAERAVVDLPGEEGARVVEYLLRDLGTYCGEARRDGLAATPARRRLAAIGARPGVARDVREALDRRVLADRHELQEVARDAVACRSRGVTGRRVVVGRAERAVQLGRVDLERRGVRQRERLES